MANNVNYVDYDAVEAGRIGYAKQATNIEDVLSALISLNGLLAEGWNNETSRAFNETFTQVHQPALEAVKIAVSDLARTLDAYSKKKRDEDTADAAVFRY